MLGAARLALALGMVAAGPGSAAGLALAGDFVWRVERDDFGGFSDLEVSANGLALIAISDRGEIYRGTIGRGPEGSITAVSVTAMLRPRDNFGRPVSGFRQDAEDIARGPDGRLYISFESYARISGFDLPDMTAHPTHDWDRFKPLWGNEGFEALAPLPGGGLVAVLEREVEGAHPVYVRSGDGWSSGTPIPGADGYSASGADLGPDGRLYLLERSYSVLFGYSVRVRRFAADPGGWGEGETLYEAADTENFEGISVWRDGHGATRVTLISDDNFEPRSRTVLREFLLQE